MRFLKRRRTEENRTEVLVKTDRLMPMLTVFDIFRLSALHIYRGICRIVSFSSNGFETIIEPIRLSLSNTY